MVQSESHQGNSIESLLGRSSAISWLGDAHDRWPKFSAWRSLGLCFVVFVAPLPHVDYRLCGRFAKQEELEQGAKESMRGSDKGSILSSASRDSLYRHFDRLTKEEQVAVLRDALNKKERLDQLEKMSDKFDESTLKGLTSNEKAERLISALTNERQSRQKKEQMFVDLIKEERNARVAAEANMKALESKIDHLASAVGVQSKKDFMKRTFHKV